MSIIVLAAALAVAVPIERHDVVVDDRGVAASFASAGINAGIVDQLDEAFATRVDLLAYLVDGAAVTAWTRGGVLVAAEVPLGANRLLAAVYDGALAPLGFYDVRGLSLVGPLRVRPVRLARVTSKYGQRFDPLNGTAAKHHGVDYAVPVGTPVLAAGRGRVKAVGESKSAGRFIKLLHEGGYESWYLHLSRIADGVAAGATVDAGDVIADSGNTGRSTGPHVHYELHLAGLPLDPLKTMPIPEVALGPLALREHRAFIKQLEAMP
jgi:murein DD-endopeptidase MepM/ murein hydrolase activator NlpD